VAEGSRYRQLAELALTFLEAQGEPQPPEAVAARVLGPAFARLPQFVSQLDAALAADDRFTRASGGCWGLGAWHHDGTAVLRDAVFAVVDVETTGGRTEKHRVVEVAAVRLEGGRIAAQFTSLVKPVTPLTKFVTDLTGITPDMVEAAPAGDAVLGELRAFIGDATVVGHNVGSDLSFLNYEAVWYGLPPFGNPALDTEELAMRLVPGLRRPSLARVAAALGMARPPRHRALADARLAADVLLVLLQRLEERGIRTMEQVQDWVRSRLAQRQARVSQVRSVLAPETFRSLPDLPGVYTFKDATGEVLYVGKAASLHNRVAQHFTGVSLVLRSHESLLDRTTTVDHEVVDCELDALLLESARIRALRPPYNVQERSRKGAPFVRLEGGTFERASAAKEVEAGAWYAGPYPTTHAVRGAIQVVRRVFLLRSCRRTLPATRAAMRIPCIKLGQGLCPAPCAGYVTPERYGALVGFARRFLLEGKEATLAALDERLADLEAEGHGAGWEAETLRGCRARLRRLRKEHRPMEGGIGGDGVALVYPAAQGGWVVFLVRNGALAGRVRCGDDGLDEQQAAALLAMNGRGEAGEADAGTAGLDADQTNILLRWIYRNAGTPAVIALPAHPTADELGEIVGRYVESRRAYAFDSGPADPDAGGTADDGEVADAINADADAAGE
jgi:DNA polymerase-3 subunit epsilon